MSSERHKKQQFRANIRDMENEFGADFKTAKQARQLETRRMMKLLLEQDKDRSKRMKGDIERWR